MPHGVFTGYVIVVVYNGGSIFSSLVQLQLALLHFRHVRDCVAMLVQPWGQDPAINRPALFYAIVVLDHAALQVWRHSWMFSATLQSHIRRTFAFRANAVCFSLEGV